MKETGLREVTTLDAVRVRTQSVKLTSRDFVAETQERVLGAGVTPPATQRRWCSGRHLEAQSRETRRGAFLDDISLEGRGGGQKRAGGDECGEECEERHP